MYWWLLSVLTFRNTHVSVRMNFMSFLLGCRCTFLSYSQYWRCQVSHWHWLRKSLMNWKHIFQDIYWLCVQGDPISSLRGRCHLEKSQDDALQLWLVLRMPMMSISFLRYFQVERDNLAQAVYGTVLYEETFIQTWSFFYCSTWSLLKLMQYLFAVFWKTL